MTKLSEGTPIHEVDNLPDDVLHPMQGIKYGGVIYVREEDCRKSVEAVIKLKHVKVTELQRELSAAQAKLKELAKLYHNAPALPLEAPGAELEKWTSILCGFGYVLNEELKALSEGERHD